MREIENNNSMTEREILRWAHLPISEATLT